MPQAFVADLHIHSKYSRACSRDLELPTLAWWARRKGVAVLGTGDFTHPAWREHLREQLQPAEPEVNRKLPPARFMLSVEISTIYKRDDRTRKVHHLIYLPDFAAVDRFTAALGRIGNLGSDGRPILGLDSRDLLEITLAASADGYLVPAHIWTPWFSALGSKSGFDAIADCYADLADQVFAVETGLSSDPAMNHRVSSLDRYRLVSNSDAHSPAAIAREATAFTTALDYYAIADALRTGDGLHGTVEFFPEEGKYHADGHRACGVNWRPEQTRAAGGTCPECGRPLTVGVLSRISELADRPAGTIPPAAAGREVTHLVPLAEVLGEIHRVGPKSKTVTGRLHELLAALGPELDVLTRVPVAEIGAAGGEVLAEAIARLRRGDVRRTAGYDGEYGVIRLFDPGELDPPGRAGADALFDLPEPAPPADARIPAGRPRTARATEPTGTPAPASSTPPRQRRPVERPAPQPALPARAEAPPAPLPSPHEPFEPVLAGMEEVGTGLLDRLDAMQRVAASAPGGPLLVVAGPGTGKTRTLTHRIAYLCAELSVPPSQCLAITFTRRAADELRGRLADLLGPDAAAVTVATFHALGLTILREHPAAAGLPADFRVADETEQAAARAEAGFDPAAAGVGRTDAEQRYRKLLRDAGLVDLDELVSGPLAVLREHPDLVDRYQARWQWIFVDEYQDVDADQYELLRLLAPPDGNLCAIGDPDQAIYAFRGADVQFFLRFSEDFVDARMVRLTRNYRSSPPVIAAALQAIAPTTLVRNRRLDPARLDPSAPLLGHYPAGSVADEAEFVARTIDQLVGGVSHRSHQPGRVDPRLPTGEVSFADIAVLYRTDAQAAPVLAALHQANIPHQKRSHDRLRNRRGVTALAAELRLAANPEAGSGGVGDRLRLAAQRLAERYAVPVLGGDEDPPTPTDVWGAVDLLRPLADRCGDDLPKFLAEVAAGTEVDALDPRAEAVTLLTLHAAKGLEFPVVFLVGVEDGLLPLTLPGRPPSPEEVAEERRLFFVGLTRAQDRIFISHSSRRTVRGAALEPRPSRFLDQIDPGLFEPLGEATPARPRHRQPRLL